MRLAICWRLVSSTSSPRFSARYGGWHRSDSRKSTTKEDAHDLSHLRTAQAATSIDRKQTGIDRDRSRGIVFSHHAVPDEW